MIRTPEMNARLREICIQPTLDDPKAIWWVMYHQCRMFALKYQYLRPGIMEFDDYYWIGMAGAWDASLRYTPERAEKAKFTTFAHPRVRGAMQDALRNTSFHSRKYSHYPCPAFHSIGRHFEEDEEEEYEWLKDETIDLDHDVWTKELRQQFSDYILTLPPMEGIFMKELYWGGLRMCEAAKYLGVSAWAAGYKHKAIMTDMRIHFAELKGEICQTSH